MKNAMVCVVLIGLFFVAPTSVFGQEVRLEFDFLRFSTGGGQKAETLFSSKSVAVNDSEAVALQAVGSLMLVFDTLQTQQARRSLARDANGGFEGNPIMGNNPSEGTIYLYMGSSLLVYNLGAFFLKGTTRDMWLKGWVTIQIGTVASNLKKGWDGF